MASVAVIEADNEMSKFKFQVRSLHSLHTEVLGKGMVIVKLAIFIQKNLSFIQQNVILSVVLYKNILSEK